jgi:integral membrane sensor domain MASE1
LKLVSYLAIPKRNKTEALMANSTRLHFALVVGVSCAVVGSLLGGVAVVLIRSWTLRGTESMTEVVTFFPMAVAFAAIPAAPFGFIVGSVGSWWLAIRAARGVSGKRLYFESAGIGGVLGSTFPLILAAFGWGPFENLVSALPISITIGIACGILITPLTRKYRPLPSPNC